MLYLAPKNNWENTMRKNLLFLLPLLLLITACSKVNDQELYDKAQKELSNQKFIEAVALFDSLLTETPNSEFAPKSLLECGKIYHSEKIPNLSKEESMNKAIHYYKRLYSEHPDFKESASAMMMTGFILANELNKPEEARTVYEEFLKKYPNSELAGSVKLELESIGLSPDEILSRIAKDKK